MQLSCCDYSHHIHSQIIHHLQQHFFLADEEWFQLLTVDDPFELDTLWDNGATESMNTRIVPPYYKKLIGAKPIFVKYMLSQLFLKS